MGVSKILLNGVVQMDITDTTATAEDVASGKIFYTADGTRTVGTGKLLTYVSSGLVAYWDGINNTGNGHSDTVTTWTDLVGGYNLAKTGDGPTWTADSLRFLGTENGLYVCPSIWEYSTAATIEMVIRPSITEACVAATFDRGAASGASGYYNARRFCLYTDNTVGFIGDPAYTYVNPAGVIADIRKAVAVYNGFTVSRAYVNNTLLSSLGSTSHSFRTNNHQSVFIGGNNESKTYSYVGEICAIRVYNRALSDVEIAQNMTYDNARFNLGL